MKVTDRNLERHIRAQRANPVEKRVILGEEIVLCESGLHHDAPGEFPLGYYLSAWFAPRDDKLLPFGVCHFDCTHDLGLSDIARQQARVEAAAQRAEDFLKTEKQAQANG